MLNLFLIFVIIYIEIQNASSTSSLMYNTYSLDGNPCFLFLSIYNTLECNIYPRNIQWIDFVLEIKYIRNNIGY